jgi:hypothetical protein
MPGLVAASRHRAGRRTPHHGRRPDCPRRIGTAGRPSPEPLNQIKAAGYKIVHIKAKEPVKTIAPYDELLAKEVKLPAVRDRPTLECGARDQRLTLSLSQIGSDLFMLQSA